MLRAEHLLPREQTADRPFLLRCRQARPLQRVHQIVDEEYKLHPAAAGLWLLLRHFQRPFHHLVLPPQPLVLGKSSGRSRLRGRQPHHFRHNRHYRARTHAAEIRAVQKIHSHLYDRSYMTDSGSISAMVLFYPLL